MKMKNNRFFDLIRLFFPPCCIVCEDALSNGEEHLCLRCLQDMPKLRIQSFEDNEVCKHFWGKIAIERACSYFHYEKGGAFDKILFKLKYQGQKEIGETMGRYMAGHLARSGFFHDIELIIPVPLHKERLRQRGYNQSEWLAKGISAVTGIPIDTTSVRRIRSNSTQTHKNRWDRWEDVQQIFSVTNPETIRGKHILLADDVLTTGATIISCASEILKTEETRISVLTLAMV